MAYLLLHIHTGTGPGQKTGASRFTIRKNKSSFIELTGYYQGKNGIAAGRPLFYEL